MSACLLAIIHTEFIPLSAMLQVLQWISYALALRYKGYSITPNIGGSYAF